MVRADDSCFEYIKHTLEPIVNVADGDIHSFEIISLSSERTLLNRICVNDADLAAMANLLMRQLEFFQKLNGYDAELYNTIFINIDPQLLFKSISWKNIVPFIFQFKIHVGFDMALVVDELPIQTLYAISRLRALGVMFWINNADEGIYKIPTERLAYFDGVKISKHCFWQFFSRKEISLLTFSRVAWGERGVIVEGVENKHHQTFLKSQGLIQSQGFHWRAKLARHLHWH